ncbi:MAG: UDP-N-acetylglucosamine--N-acetylmuramyl-(pentapeptide) pyrophosphoryl-undecaprenol N-acetylglucosamine transferase [Blastochloris sp.]|nr:UDP-N-acetylglucosamine--N-acetylmuramyl-(pentapeptide) pyrophosphoryl-undecaprenol N-acetylglucosamine transferase [Blastochloris sp.]
MATIGIACGGTGGHLYPGLAVAEKLVEAGHTVRLYISNKEIDRKVMESYPQMTAVVLPTMGWPGLGPGLFRFVLQYIKAHQIAVREIREQRLAVVLGMGGFACAPILIAAARRRLPTLLHESNAIPGKVTRLLAGRVNRVLLGFEECAEHLKKAKCLGTGTPLRSSLKRMEKSEAFRVWPGQLREGRMTIAVMGGSQGASGLNQMMMEALKTLESHRDEIQFVHQTGERDRAEVEAKYRQAGFVAEVMSFCQRMDALYSLADVMVARSGAASLTEIGYFGIPSLLVPYPHAAEDHQSENARVFVRAGAAEMIAEKEGAGALGIKLRQWIEDEAARAVVAGRAGSLGRKDAAARVAQEVLNVL